jgi:hypothetical protein
MVALIGDRYRHSLAGPVAPDDGQQLGHFDR